MSIFDTCSSDSQEILDDESEKCDGDGEGPQKKSPAPEQYDVWKQQHPGYQAQQPEQTVLYQVVAGEKGERSPDKDGGGVDHALEPRRQNDILNKVHDDALQKKEVNQEHDRQQWQHCNEEGTEDDIKELALPEVNEQDAEK